MAISLVRVHKPVAKYLFGLLMVEPRALAGALHLVRGLAKWKQWRAAPRTGAATDGAGELIVAVGSGTSGTGGALTLQAGRGSVVTGGKQLAKR